MNLWTLLLGSVLILADRYVQILDSALESLLVLCGQIYANSGLCPREPPYYGGQIQYLQILDSAP